jgi:DTW domain-containing protein YfiP
MHRDELLKPTNTGRLLAELFPSHTHIFEWSRTEPPEGIENLICDPSRQVLLVFPSDNAITPYTANFQATQSQLRHTLILLDGTWKQARKMFNRTPWLAGLRSISPTSQAAAQYALRKAAHANCLSTAEAAILLLEDFDPSAALALGAVFSQFNQGYALSRGVRPQDTSITE